MHAYFRQREHQLGKTHTCVQPDPGGPWPLFLTLNGGLTGSVISCVKRQSQYAWET